MVWSMVGKISGSNKKTLHLRKVNSDVQRTVLIEIECVIQ